MFSWHWCSRLLPIVAIVGAVGFAPAVHAQPAPPLPGSGAASLLPADPIWVVNFESIPERSAPFEESDTIATLRKFTYLAVKRYVGEWAEVFNPRTRASGFIPSDAIGPADTPPDYIIADPPPTVDVLQVSEDPSSA